MSKKRKKRSRQHTGAETRGNATAATEAKSGSLAVPRDLARSDEVTDEVPTLKRFGAYAVDWALGGIVTGAPAVLLYGAVTRRTDFYSDLYVFEALGHSMWWGVF